VTPRFAGAVALAVVMVSGCTQRPTGNPQFATAASGFGDFRVPVASLLARKYATVIRQQYDFSCGSAALATLLHYHYAMPSSETDTFMGMWREGDQANIRRVGFSLLDMKRYLSNLKLSADGYKVSLDAIQKRNLPGIALITNRGYRHFVVVKGVTANEVLLGDPSLGLQTMSRAQFESLWNGVYFVLNSRQEVGRLNFNGTRQWQAFARAPVGVVAAPFLDPLSPGSLALTAPRSIEF
jgi:uncharacterized protein